jgi:hypothetical protein
MTYRHHSRRAASVATLLIATLSGCKDEPPPTREPPPPAAAPATCSGARKVADESNVALFPTTAGDYCLDPNGSDKGYGEGAKLPLEAICDLFDGECEIYKGFDVRRVVEARYVDGKGSGRTLDVKLSKYASAENAYAMFTKRTVGEGDPAHDDAPRPIEGGGAAALGWGNAYLWRATHLAEITFNDVSTASDKEIKARADQLLPALVKDFGEKLGGEPTLPPSAAHLPTEKRLPLGIRLVTDKLLGVDGSGSGAFGYYRDGALRWRVLSSVKGDKDQARDTLKSFAALAGAATEKGIGDAAVRLMVKDGAAQVEWLVAAIGARVVGVGDEPRVLRAGMSPAEHREKTLTQDQKRELLRSLLAP